MNRGGGEARRPRYFSKISIRPCDDHMRKLAMDRIENFLTLNKNIFKISTVPL